MPNGDQYQPQQSQADFLKAIKTKEPRLAPVPDDKLWGALITRRPDLPGKLLPAGVPADPVAQARTSIVPKELQPDKQPQATMGPQPSEGRKIWEALKQGPAAFGTELGKATRRPFEDPTMMGGFKVPGTGTTLGEAAQREETAVNRSMWATYLIGPGAAAGGGIASTVMRGKQGAEAIGEIEAAAKGLGQTVDITNLKTITSAGARLRKYFYLPKPVQTLINQRAAGTTIEFEDARNAYKSIGHLLKRGAQWDGPKAGTVIGLMKKMYAELGEYITQAAEAMGPKGTGKAWEQALEDYKNYQDLLARGKKVGSLAKKLIVPALAGAAGAAGYEALTKKRAP